MNMTLCVFHSVLDVSIFYALIEHLYVPLLLHELPCDLAMTA